MSQVTKKDPENVTVVSDDLDYTEAPVTWRTYAMCIFASFGGIFFGYDSGYIGGVQGMSYFIHMIDGPDATALESSQASLIVSILSAGTFFGALIAGDLSDWFGRRFTIIAGCGVFIVGVILQTASASLGLLVAGRLIAGFGVGFVSAIIVLYMSEIAPKKVRGAIVSGYQFCVTIGLLLAACVTYGTENRNDSGSYRIPVGLQMLWAIILATGLFILPESPRFFVKKGKIDEARAALSRVRGQPSDSHYIQAELDEIIANAEYERRVIPNTGYFGSWAACFSGSLFKAKSNVRKVILGTSIQMMQQWTGVNFVFYYSTAFLQSTGAVSNPFLMSLIFTLVNVCTTPLSFWMIERFGRRAILIWGAVGMTICEFIVAIVGVTVGFDKTQVVNGASVPTNISAVNAQIAFIAIYIFFFATTWGPAAWVVIGEIFPLPIRSRGVALSTASNWLWNCIIAVITPYLVGPTEANLQSKVFFLWGSLCFSCIAYAYFLVPETKGLTLEQVDQMMDEVPPRKSAAWKPTSTFAKQLNRTEAEKEAAQ
ncbi:major facilitator superfamily transporter monosaccharide [Umbelopsis sp. PMI_123]|nr:major facilitator superfamily transporter monosaccharide [Umbelopsis sp. PMI_123]